jgi:hypothetical protein
LLKRVLLNKKIYISLQSNIPKNIEQKRAIISILLSGRNGVILGVNVYRIDTISAVRKIDLVEAKKLDATFRLYNSKTYPKNHK